MNVVEVISCGSGQCGASLPCQRNATVGEINRAVTTTVRRVVNRQKLDPGMPLVLGIYSACR